MTPLEQQRALAGRFRRSAHSSGISACRRCGRDHCAGYSDDNNPPDNDNWHTDVTFIENAACRCDFSREKAANSSGGDTLWASGIAAL
jgi:taurine dioxygenase